MDPELAAFKIEEVISSLQRISEAVRSSRSLSALDDELRTEFELVYRRLNRVWNTRHLGGSDYDQSSREQFDQWSQFPDDLLA